MSQSMNSSSYTILKRKAGVVGIDEKRNALRHSVNKEDVGEMK
jgi:hypothetical protein